MKMRFLAVTMAIAALPAASAWAEECGDVTIAEFSWQSASALTNLDALILEKGYGCNVSIVAGDTVPTITSMAEKGQPDLSPETNLVLLPEVAKRGVEEGRMVSLNHPIVEGTLEGWYIPKYVADEHPDIKTVLDALKHPELFPAPEDSSKGGILKGPQGWGGTVVTEQLFKAFEAEKAGFVLVDTGSAAGLDGAIGKAYERKQGFIGYYWSPTSLLSKYPMVRLEGGVERDNAEWNRCTTVPSCTDPKPNYWVPDPVDTLATKGFLERPGSQPALEYLKTRKWDTATVSELMVWMDENQATGADGARHFLEKREDVWSKWVPADIAEKVKSSL